MPFTYAGHYSPEAFINSYGVPLRDQPITVYLAGTLTLATLYTDRTKSTTAANPTSTDSRGNGHFWAEPGLYDLLVNGVTISSVGVPVDPAEDFELEDHDHDADYEAAGSVATHQADTTSVHGISDTTVLATDTDVATAVSDHAALADPHTVYQKESEKNATNGYAGLDGSTLIDADQLGTGTADATTFLRGDRSWQIVEAGGSIAYQASAPSSPATGDLWADSDETTPTQSGSSVRTKIAARTSGDLTLNSTNWADVDTGLDLTLPAAAGDIFEVTANGLCDVQAVNVFFDAVSVVSAAPVNSFGQNAAVTTAPPNYGITAWRCTQSLLERFGIPIHYTIQAGDISGGNVTVRLRYATSSATNRTLFASSATGFIFKWSVKNLGASA